MTIGSVRTAKVRIPAIALTPKPQTVTKKANPNKPKTMDGTPARLATAKVMSFLSGPSFAYSLSQTAQTIPRGSATAIAPMDRIAVPMMQGRIPPSSIIFSGKEERNEGESVPAPW